MTSPWAMWRPLHSSLLGGSPYPAAAERSLYALYGGLFGLNNSNFVFPTLGLHPLMAANNMNSIRLREGGSSTPVYHGEGAPAAHAHLHNPGALYRYHPYLSADKFSSHKTPTSSTESSPGSVDGGRP